MIIIYVYYLLKFLFDYAKYYFYKHFINYEKRNTSLLYIRDSCIRFINRLRHFNRTISIFYYIYIFICILKKISTIYHRVLFLTITLRKIYFAHKTFYVNVFEIIKLLLKNQIDNSYYAHTIKFLVRYSCWEITLYTDN